MATEAFRIEVLSPAQVERAALFFDYFPADSDDLALRKNMASGDWVVVMASSGGVDVGGFYLNWNPKYPLYQRLHLPELQDLRVLPGFRRQGLGEALIEKAEDLARTGDAKGMGLSVGLTPDYGPAQRLYARMNYIPDGQGVTYDRQTVQKGEKWPINDDLALMLIKFF